MVGLPDASNISFSIREALIKCISGLPGETESMYCVIYEVIPKNTYLMTGLAFNLSIT